MTIDKEKIRAAAMEANTHGAWKIGAMESGMYAVDDADNCEVTGWIEPEVALHIIASDPSTVLSLLAALDKAEKERDCAVWMLAEWANAVDTNGTGWDDWDEYYKDAAYRPCIIRELLDDAIKSMKGGE